ncbi:hypothetical protein [Methanococcus vannielii]|nr:hypothetical protein [Methanococcus vannielii]
MSILKSVKNIWRKFRGKPDIDLQEFIDFCKKRGSFKSIEDCKEYLLLKKKLKEVSNKE